MANPKLLDWGPFREAFPTILRGRASLNAEEHHRDLVWGLFAALEAVALRQRESGEEPLSIREVKSKYGGLRFDADHAPPEADDLMTEAENRSDPPEDPPPPDPSDDLVVGWFDGTGHLPGMEGHDDDPGLTAFRMEGW